MLKPCICANSALNLVGSVSYIDTYKLSKAAEKMFDYLGMKERA